MRTLRFTIPSDLAAGHDVQRRILDDLGREGFSEPSLFGVRLALEEALVNAIKHGNKLDRMKKVHVEARVSPRLAEITIEDEGPGFDRGTVPDCTRDENLEKCCGRGVLLMETYMNHVEWSRGGRRVRMIRRNEQERLPHKPNSHR